MPYESFETATSKKKIPNSSLRVHSLVFTMLPSIFTLAILAGSIATISAQSPEKLPPRALCYHLLRFEIAKADPVYPGSIQPKSRHAVGLKSHRPRLFLQERHLLQYGKELRDKQPHHCRLARYGFLRPEVANFLDSRSTVVSSPPF